MGFGRGFRRGLDGDYGRVGAVAVGAFRAFLAEPDEKHNGDNAGKAI